VTIMVFDHVMTPIRATVIPAKSRADRWFFERHHAGELGLDLVFVLGCVIVAIVVSISESGFAGLPLVLVDVVVVVVAVKVVPVAAACDCNCDCNCDCDDVLSLPR